MRLTHILAAGAVGIAAFALATSSGQLPHQLPAPAARATEVPIAPAPAPEEGFASYLAAADWDGQLVAGTRPILPGKAIQVVVTRRWAALPCFDRVRLADSLLRGWRTAGGAVLTVVDENGRTVADTTFGGTMEVPRCES